MATVTNTIYSLLTILFNIKYSKIYEKDIYRNNILQDFSGISAV